MEWGRTGGAGRTETGARKVDTSKIREGWVELGDKSQHIDKKIQIRSQLASQQDAPKSASQQRDTSSGHYFKHDFLVTHQRLPGYWLGCWGGGLSVCQRKRRKVDDGKVEWQIKVQRSVGLDRGDARWIMVALERRGQAKLLSLSILLGSRIFDPATSPHPLSNTQIGIHGLLWPQHNWAWCWCRLMMEKQRGSLCAQHRKEAIY